jgi:hypothetical protein
VPVPRVNENGCCRAAPESELADAGDNPQRLARVATRAEMSEPGTMERVYGQMARLNREVDVAQGLNAGKTLAYAAHFENCGHRAITSIICLSRCGRTQAGGGADHRRRRRSPQSNCERL